MRFTVLDWLIVAAVLGGLLLVAVRLRSRVKSVSDFLAANRCAGRYLLTISQGMAGMGAVTLVANWEKFYQSGFGGAFWGFLLHPIALIIALSGWVQYRYRETRALTLAQFFEMRYSKRFRVFAGCLAWAAGVLNYGIFPGVTARVIMHFAGIPSYRVPVLGMEVDLTMGIVMAVMLGIALFITLSAGQVAVMVTDFLQGLLFYLTFIVIVVLLLWQFGWSEIIETLVRVAPEKQSMINPFQQQDVPDFNVWFFVMLGVMAFYGKLAWQGSQAFFVAAKSPHEARMAGILSDWRSGVMYMVMLLLPVCAFVLLNGGGDVAAGGEARAMLDAIADPQVREQMNTPVALTVLLPQGLVALLLASVCCLAISTDTSYLHSWGSIFIQDVLTPFRKEPLGTDGHLKWLRQSIFGVALFAWIFSMIFPLQEYILMYFFVTGAIFTGGAGAVIIGGLYWRRGTTPGAWSALITGGVLALAGVLINNVIWPKLLPIWKAQHPDIEWLARLPEKFWLNGAQLAFTLAWVCMSVYVVVSLATCRKPFDIDRMLHRTPDANSGAGPTPKRGWRALGMGPEFTRGDRLIYLLTLGWTVFFFASTLVIIVAQQMRPLSDAFWSGWWLFSVILGLSAGTITLIWFAIGGSRDTRDLFQALRRERVDVEDDGRVQ